MVKMAGELKILLIEDVPADAELELRELKRAGVRCSAHRVETEEAFRREFTAFEPQVTRREIAASR
jgi:hypothetical protein